MAGTPLRGIGCASTTLVALLVACGSAGAEERWSGTMTRLGWDLFERQLPSPDEPVAFSFAGGARTISAFSATVREFCPQPDVQVWEPEVVEEDGTLTPGYWESYPQPLVKHMRQLRQAGRVSVARNGSFAVSGGAAGAPGSWRFTGRLKTDRFGNVVREVVGAALVEDSTDGCTQDDGLRRTDPHWHAYGPALPRPRVGVSVARLGPARYRATFRVSDRHGRRVPRARVWFAHESAHGVPQWAQRKVDRTGRATFPAGPGRYELRIGGRGVGTIACSVNILDRGRSRDTC